MQRIKLLNFIIGSMFFMLCLGLVNLALIRGRAYKELSNKNSIRLLPQLGARGNILDRRGNIIVDNKLSYDCMAIPQELSHPDKQLAVVSKVLGVRQDVLKKTYRSGLVAFSVPVVIVENLDTKKAITLEELKSDLPGIFVQTSPKRHYPYGKLASHVLGYVSEIDRWRLTKLEDYGYKTRDIVGFGGVEEKYDYYLRQEEGGLSVEVDHLGRSVRILGFRPPSNGRDIQLTLDLKIQKIAEDNLAGKKGCIVIMDPDTGEIIALASGPDFDPQVFVDNSDPAVISGLFNNKDSVMINRGISAAYPPGSVFKVIVAAAALETNKINMGTAFLCQGAAFVGRQKFACWATHGQQDLISAIAHSCNVFFYKAGLLSGARSIHNYAVKFGLSASTGLELPYEVSGFIPSPLWRKINKFKNWFDGDTANLSIGQGDCLVTPLQMARVMSVFANGGHLVSPYIVKSVGSKDLEAYKRRSFLLSIKSSTINNIRKGLFSAVTSPGGTANVLSGLSVTVAGKTGTAQAPPGESHAWFTGFFPFEDSRFVICVLLEHGGGGHNAAFLAKQIIEQMGKEGLI